MEVANTNVNMTDSGNSTSVDTSSSIRNTTSNSSYNNSNTATNTSSYQTNQSNSSTNVEEIDLSAEQEEGFFEQAGKKIDNGLAAAGSAISSGISAVGDFFADTGKKIYDTGAKVVNGTKSFIVDGLKGIGASLAETAANVASNVKSLMGAIGDAFKGGPKALLATGAVIATSIKSGVLKIGEHLLDTQAWINGKEVRGATWLVGKIVGLFNEDAGDAIIESGKSFEQASKEFIAKDLVGELNQWFYESTPVGRWINENSTIKYDSDLALGLRKVSERAAEIVAAAAITAATGGAAAFAVGAMYGIGKSAEQTYQKHGTDSTVLQELGIIGSGALTGLSWMATGKLVNGFVEIGKTAATEGIGNVLSGLSKDILTRDFWEKALESGLTGVNGLTNIASSAMMTGEELMPYINGTKEWSVEGVTKLAWHFALCLGLNIAEDALRGYVNDFDPNKLGHYNDATDAAKVVTEAEQDASKVDSNDASKAETGTSQDSSVQTPAEPQKNYRSYGSYHEATDDLAANRAQWDQVNSETGGKAQELLTGENGWSGYKGETVDSPGYYSAVNGILRGSLIDAKAKTITIIGTFGTPETFSFEDFEAAYKINPLDYYDIQLKAAEELSDAISKCTLGQDMRLERGVNWDALKFYGISEGDSPAEILKKLQDCGGIKDPGFMSACPSNPYLPWIVTSKDIRFVMDVDADTPAVDLSRWNSGEQEILLGNGLEFSVTDVQQDPITGLIRIFMKKR